MEEDLGIADMKIENYQNEDEEEEDSVKER